MTPMVDCIVLDGVLPQVFRGMERVRPVCDSQVWLKRLEFKRGGHYLVSAESGGGKSSLISFLFGNRSDYDGVIEFDGRNIRQLTDADWSAIRCRSLALLPQELRLFPELTVNENIEIKNRLTGSKSQSEINAMLTLLGVDSKADVPVGRLSVGQQQRVALVRALCQPFDFLLLDEPVSHLDSRNNAVVAELVTGHARECGAGIITTSVGNHLALKSFIEIKL